jgi:type VI secretion system secreted protein Hcp
MTMPAYLKATAASQGNIEGSCDIKGHENTMLINEIHHSIEIPKSPQTGLPTGKRIHNPLKVMKNYDKASPKLFQALCTGEQFSSVMLEYYWISKDGKEEKYFTTELKNAIIVSIDYQKRDVLDPLSGPHGDEEHVSFTYETIVQTWVKDGIEAQDSWTGSN